MVSSLNFDEFTRFQYSSRLVENYLVSSMGVYQIYLQTSAVKQGLSIPRGQEAKEK